MCPPADVICLAYLQGKRNSSSKKHKREREKQSRRKKHKRDKKDSKHKRRKTGGGSDDDTAGRRLTHTEVRGTGGKSPAQHRVSVEGQLAASDRYIVHIYLPASSAQCVRQHCRLLMRP